MKAKRATINIEPREKCIRVSEQMRFPAHWWKDTLFQRRWFNPFDVVPLAETWGKIHFRKRVIPHFASFFKKDASRRKYGFPRRCYQQPWPVSLFRARGNRFFWGEVNAINGALPPPPPLPPVSRFIVLSITRWKVCDSCFHSAGNSVNNNNSSERSAFFSPRKSDKFRIIRSFIKI